MQRQPIAREIPTPSQLSPADLMTPEQAAQALGLSVKTLATWRSTGRHALPFIRCGARIRYRRADLAAWLQGRQSTRTADAAKGVA
ncbi:Helix-turn-helix domain protein [compost metagenome]